MINKVNASGIILTHKGKFLLMLRDDKPDINDPNKWGFFGGGKEEGETFEQAAIRELYEETHIKAESLTFLTNFIYNDREKYFYHKELTDKDMQDFRLGEGQEEHMFTLEEMGHLPLAFSTNYFLQNYRDLLLKFLVLR